MGNKQKYPNITTGNMANIKANMGPLSSYNADIDINKYAKLLYNLYNATYIPITITHKSITRHFNRPFQINKAKYDAICDINAMATRILLEPPDFNDLFWYGTFIKILEKAFSYKNDRDNTFVCDSNLDDNTNRIIVIQNTDHFIKFELTKGTTNNTIDITINRLYGKKMRNTYHVVDRESKDIIDNSDIILMNNINQILQKYMVSLLITYAQIIADKDVETFFENPSKVKLTSNAYVYYSEKQLNPEGKLEFKLPMWYKDLKWYIRNVEGKDPKYSQCIKY